MLLVPTILVQLADNYSCSLFTVHGFKGQSFMVLPFSYYPSISPEFVTTELATTIGE